MSCGRYTKRLPRQHNSTRPQAPAPHARQVRHVPDVQAQSASVLPDACGLRLLMPLARRAVFLQQLPMIPCCHRSLSLAFKAVNPPRVICASRLPWQAKE